MKKSISRNYLTKKIREAKETELNEEDFSYEGKSIITTDYEPISKIEIKFDEESFIISFFEKHNWKAKEKRYATTIKDAIAEIGAYLPNSLKLRVNY